ncbi:MAG: Veg family protein [Eubacterium sp.]|nr:Veg family protein [Eubacterium sp.]
MANASVGSVRRAVSQHVGSKVRVRSNLGRHKYDVTEGVITETYPCIFLVRVENAEEDSFQTVSYSYTDVITKDVQLTLC